MDMPPLDPVGRNSSYDSRGSFVDRGGGRGRGGVGGGRGFSRDGSGRGGGRGELGRFGSAGRDTTEFRDREGPPGPPGPGFRPSESSRKQDANASTGDFWRPRSQWPPVRQERDLPLHREQLPPRHKPVSDFPPTTGSTREFPATKPEPVKPVRVEPEEEKVPRPISPPPPGKPSGVVLALARLADLEAQMEYAYAKHMQLVKRQKELRSQAKVLETLPVGIEAFKEELEALDAAAAADGEEEWI